MPCHGNGPDHCCYIGGEVCPHLRENVVPGRRWACGLLVDLGSWEAVHAAPEYEPIRARLRAVGIRTDCGDWPQAALMGRKPGAWACCWGEC